MQDLIEFTRDLAILSLWALLWLVALTGVYVWVRSLLRAAKKDGK